VLRRVTLLLVLLLASGYALPLVCHQWCPTAPAAGMACGHKSPAATTLATDSRCASGSSLAPAIREDLRRDASDVDNHYTISRTHLEDADRSLQAVVVPALAWPFASIPTARITTLRI